MDDEKPPKELVTKIFIAIIIAIIQAIVFSYYTNIGIFLIAGILIFMFVFSQKNKSLKKQEIINSTKINEWYKSKYTLSKNIP